MSVESVLVDPPYPPPPPPGLCGQITTVLNHTSFPLVP